MFFDRFDGGHEAVAVEAIGVELVRRLIGGADHHHALLEHHLKQTPENYGVTDVIDEQLVKTQNLELFAQLLGQNVKRVGGTGQLKQPLMHPLHKVMEMLAPRRDLQALVKLIHQPGFPPAHRPPQIHAPDLPGALLQSLVATLQHLYRLPLGRIMDKTLLLDGLLPGTEGGLNIHCDDGLRNQIRQYASKAMTFGT